MSHPVLVIGNGTLADAVCTLLTLKSSCKVIRQSDLVNAKPAANTKLAVVLHDSWHPQIHKQAEAVFRKAGIPWLRGFVTFGLGIIGPLSDSREQGCSQCADLRKIMAEEERNQLFQLKAALEVYGGQDKDVWASGTGILQMAYVLVAMIEEALAAPNESSLFSHLICVNLKTLATSRHFFLPDPNCPICSHLENDCAEGSKISLVPSPKTSVDSYRCRHLDELAQNLEKDYVDYHTGLLNAKVHDLITPFTAISVNLPLLMGDEGSGGRSHSYKVSSWTAILEGLERYCGLEPRGKRSVVYDSYANLKHQALNPERVGLHAPEQYAKPDFPFHAFTPELPLSWVWGYSLTKKQPILVPELLAYYSMGCRPGFVYETSNGCAIGSNIVEAIFHGILEVVERDAFLITWYARLPLPGLDISSVDDLELKWMVERMRLVAGYELHLFNATMENRIPSIFAIAKNRRGKGVNLICAAGSHLNPISALKGAIHELAGMLLRFDEKLEANRNRYMEMYKDSTQVRHMEDHSMLYGLPEAEERLSFLFNHRKDDQLFTEAFYLGEKHLDLTEDLLTLLNGFERQGLDVIVVDQTSPELKKNGLCCVKVLIPGMLPMTFGHHLVRLEGLGRVLRVPRELGYTDRLLTKSDLNPYPHPFP